MIQIPPDYCNDEIHIEYLPSAEKMQWTPLLPAYIKVMRLNLLMIYLLVMAGFALLLWFITMDESGWIRWLPCAPILLLPLIYLINMLWIRRAYAIRGFVLRERDLSYRSGYFIRRVQTVPIRNVQQVTLQQGIISRLFGLYSLSVSDASQGATALLIPGLTEQIAEDLKQYIITQAALQRGEKKATQKSHLEGSISNESRSIVDAPSKKEE